MRRAGCKGIESMKLKSNSVFRKAAVALLGTALAGSFVAATVLSAAAQPSYVAYIYYADEYGNERTISCSSMGEAASEAAKLGSTALTISLNCDCNLKNSGSMRLEVPNNANWTINLNGHMIDRGLSNSSYEGSSKGEVFHVWSNANLTINGGADAASKSLTHSGHTVTDSNGGKFWLKGSAGQGETACDISGGLITGGACDDENGAGAIAIEGSNSTVTLNNVTLAGNLADDYTILYDGDGGAVAIRDGSKNTLTLNYTDVIYNHAENDGGAIYVTTTGNTINVSNGSSVSYNSSAGSGTTSNERDGGGAIYFNKESNTLYVNGASKINGNTTKGYGGAIKTLGSSKLYIDTKSEVNDNHAAKDGGAIYSIQDDGLINISDSSLCGNSSGVDGGAIFLCDETTLWILKGSKVKDNTAAGDAGAVYVDDSETYFHIKEKNEKGESNTITGNTAGDEGGAFYIDGSDADIGVYDGTCIDSNTAQNDGGAIYYNASDGEVEFNGEVSLSSNKSKEGNGGAIYNRYDGTTYKFNGATIDHNWARNGGAIYAEDRMGCTFDHGSVSSNTAYSGDGGAFYIAEAHRGYLRFNNTKLDSNTAYKSGGVFFEAESASIDLTSGTTVSNNKATNGSGGVLFAGSTCEFDTDNVSIHDNSAASVGGVVYMASTGSVDLYGSSHVFQNKANSGGAFYMAAGGEVQVRYSSELSSNTATGGNGGAICIPSGNLDMQVSFSGKMNSNSASADGGALYAGGGATIYMNGGSAEIRSNTAGGNGGAMYLSGAASTVIMYIKAQLSDNVAQESGGGIYSTKDVDFRISYSTASGCVAKGGSGGLICAKDANVSMVICSDAVISSCAAESSAGKGGVACVDGGTLTVNNDRSSGRIEDCSAETSGGAFYATGKGDSKISNVTIAGCKAAIGSAVYFTGGMKLADVTFSDNASSEVEGGAVRCNNSSTESYSVSLAGNVQLADNFDCNSARSNLVINAGQPISCLSDEELNANSKVYVTVAGYDAVSYIQLSADEAFAKAAAGSLYSDDNSYSVGYKADDDPQLYLCPVSAGVARGADGTYYESLAAAIEAAESGSTVTLLRDTSEQISVSGKELTVELARFTLTSPDGNAALTVGEEGVVNLSNGNVASNDDAGDAIAVTGGSLKLSKVSASSASGKAVRVDSGSVAVADDGCSLVSQTGPALVLAGGSAEVSGGSFNGVESSVLVTSGELKVSNGSFAASLCVSGKGTASVSGGEFSAGFTVADSGLATISGGSFAAGIDVSGEGSAVVSGGVFGDASYAAYLAAGKAAYKPQEENYAVTDANDVLRKSACVVVSESAASKVYFQSEDEASAYAQALDDAVLNDVLYVTFDPANNGESSSVPVESGQPVAQPENPSYSDHAFTGWTLDGAAYDFTSPVTADITLVATWVDATYTVDFDSNGGSEVSTQTVAYLGQVQEPDAPTYVGYAFNGWLLDGAAYDFSTPVTSSMTLTASWVPVKCTVTFDSLGGSSVESQTVDYGQTVTEPKAPILKGHSFIMWRLNGKEYSFGDAVTGNITLEAYWAANTYIVNFDSAGGSYVDSQSVRYGEKATAPVAPTRQGYIFNGWELKGVAYDFDQIVTQELTLTATWINNECTVSFDSAGGSSVQTQTVVRGEKATEPSAPTRTGYIFHDWLLNGTPYDFDTPVAGDITLTASWKAEQRTVTFDSAGGTAVATQTVDYGQCAAEPVAPTREGYKFAAWSLGDRSYSFEEAVTNNITLTAVWIADTYTVNFDSAGGSYVAGQSVRYGQTVAEPAAPTRSGYDFAGWRLSGEAYDFSAAVTGNLTLTAVWTAKADPAPAPDEAGDGYGSAISLTKVTGVKAKATGKKKVKVTWAAAKDARTGVQIRYSYKKNMKKAKTVTVKSAKAAKKVLKKLEKGKRVFIQVRACKAANGQKIYGAWSAKAKVKVK